MRVTEKQKKLMKKLGLTPDSKMTKDEASLLIAMELETLSQIEDMQYNSCTDDFEIPYGYDNNWADE